MYKPDPIPYLFLIREESTIVSSVFIELRAVAIVTHRLLSPSQMIPSPSVCIIFTAWLPCRWVSTTTRINEFINVLSRARKVIGGRGMHEPIYTIRLTTCIYPSPIYVLFILSVRITSVVLAVFKLSAFSAAAFLE